MLLACLEYYWSIRGILGSVCGVGLLQIELRGLR